MTGLTDERVIHMRQQAWGDPQFDSKYYAQLWGISVFTVEKAMRGETYKKLNSLAPPFKKTSKLNDEIVKDLRLQAAQGGYPDLHTVAIKLDITVSSLEKAILGLTYSHLNKEAPPFVRVIAKQHAQTQARIMYETGLTFSKIQAILQVSRSSLSKWLKDIPKHKRVPKNPKAEPTSPRKSRLEPIPKVVPVRIRTRNGCQVLKDSHVLEMRKAVREEGHLNLRKWAGKYGVSKPTIAFALRGVTFKHLNDQEPPIVEKLPSYPVPAAVPRRWVNEEVFAEAISLRRSDPEQWSIKALTKWVNEKTGSTYRTQHVSKIMYNRDPTLREIKVEKPPKPKREKKVRVKKTPQLYERECVWCESSFETKYKTKETCSDTCSVELRKFANY